MMIGNDTDNDNSPSFTFDMVLFNELPVAHALMF
jgi:hypothetical protein